MTPFRKLIHQNSVDTSGDANVTCSNFNNNTLYGIDANNVGGALTLNSVSFDANGSGDYVYPGSPIINNVNCDPGGSCEGPNPENSPDPPTNPDHSSDLPTKPVTLIPVTGGELVYLDCTTNKDTTLSLPNGDFVYFPCPIQGSAGLERVGPDDLPSNLPDGDSYQSGFTTVVTENGLPKEGLGGFMTVFFQIPVGADPSNLTILYWDGSDWVELSNGVDLGDGKKVGLGGFVSLEGTHFQAKVNFTGTFVLVSR